MLGPEWNNKCPDTVIIDQFLLFQSSMWLPIHSATRSFRLTKKYQYSEKNLFANSNMNNENVLPEGKGPVNIYWGFGIGAF